MGVAIALIAWIVPSIALADEDPSERLVSSLHYDSSLREVLDGLFAGHSLTYHLEESIQGRISVRLPTMPFDSALQRIVKSCGLTYRCEGGVYMIIRRQVPPEYRKEDEEFQRKVTKDPRILIIRRDMPEFPVAAIQAKDEDAAALLRRIMWSSDQYFVIGMGIEGKVTADFPAQPLRDTLSSLVVKWRGELEYVNRVWTICGPNPDPPN